jgi:dTDP-glucose 4,6-dehydratase
LLRKRTIVVTGGLGFIGSHFVELLLSRGHKVYNIDCETYAANKNLSFSGEYVHIPEDISKITDVPSCDIIVNFAAESHVDNSINSSSDFIHTNVLGVHNMLNIVKNKKIKNLQTSWHYKAPLFVQISTDEVFGDILDGFFKEQDTHTPSNPYSATKSCAEQLVCAWGRTYELPFLITRTTNNYGCRQHEEKLIPAVITRLLKGEKVMVHGDGRYIRNWIHVEDNVDALHRVIDVGEVNNAYHISSDEEYSVRQVVEKVCERFNVKYDDVVDSSSDRNGCDERYALDSTKLKAHTNWRQTRMFDVELDKIIDYHRARLA